MSSPRRREAVRVIVLDRDDRVLLLRYEENGSFWAVPGGARDPGESPLATAGRELREELGVMDVRIGPELAVRSKDHLVGGEPARQIEKYFVTVLSAEAIAPALASQPDNIRAWRWWTLSQMRETTQTIYPLGLADLITDYLLNGPPATPTKLAG